MTPYSRFLLGIKPGDIYIPRRLILPKKYFKIIKKIFFRRWKRNLDGWTVL
jgi:hypothetical protein